MKRIYIVRHGQSVANAEKTVCGTIDSPLSELGKHQAKIAGELASRYQFDLIISSPMARAHDTAKIIAEQIGYDPAKIVLLPELSERDLGEAEGKSYDLYPTMSGKDDIIEQVPGVEPIGDFHTRAGHALQAILAMHNAQHILVVCHNGMGRMLKVVAHGGKPLDLYATPRLENATISELKA